MQNKNYKISIIVATFNNEKTIDKNIESILLQTFTDYEIIIIDGNSRDKTLEKIKKYNSKKINIYMSRQALVSIMHLMKEYNLQKMIL